MSNKDTGAGKGPNVAQGYRGEGWEKSKLWDNMKKDKKTCKPYCNFLETINPDLVEDRLGVRVCKQCGKIFGND